MIPPTTNKIVFPERPKWDCKGYFAPIWFEPMILSGERINVGICAITCNENEAEPQSLVAPAPGLVRLKEMLGEKGGEFAITCTNEVLSDLAEALKGSVAAHEMGRDRFGMMWKPPFEGFGIGPSTRTARNCIEDIIDQGFTMRLGLLSKEGFK